MGRDKIEEMGGDGRKLQDCNSVHRIMYEMVPSLVFVRISGSDSNWYG